jgi:LacI family transcriptional regulator
MPKKRATLKDIAERLQLSIPTVSRALAGHPDISDETQQRVRAMAEELGYMGADRGRTPETGPRRLIVMIVPEINMFFSPGLMTGLTRVLQQHDYALVIQHTGNSSALERELVEKCVQLQPEGVLIALSRETVSLDHLEILRRRNIPTALFDKTLETNRFSTLTLDDVEAGQLAAEHLLQQGHRRILGLFSDPRMRISMMRMRGFRRAHADRMLPLDEAQLVQVRDLADFDAEYGRALQAFPDATATFAMSDELLVHAHHALMRRGIAIPEPMSLLAISEGHAPEFLYPKVTHLLHSGAQVGERMAHIMMGLILHPSSSAIDVRIHTQLVERGSVVRRGRPINHPD